jgi:putative ABC transport system ATP-binding protein
MNCILRCQGIERDFGLGGLRERVLRGVDASFAPGESCVLMGPSGSGKTTLLAILGCLLTPTAGQVLLGGVPIDYSNKGLLAKLRRQQYGFVFQHSQLLPFCHVRNNLEIAGRNAKVPPDVLGQRIDGLLKRLGINGLEKKRPNQLSGGQQQRVAIARALLHRPAIILADEPTAALDWETGQTAVGLLIEESANLGALLLAVSHDARLLRLFRRHLYLDGGQLQEGRHPCES